ncbi:MAG: hypothetical protein GSR85_00405 [Desulfurococcales archaeon]|nr:hypothetical protein [Desulfurococcales archaeon]
MGYAWRRAAEEVIVELEQLRLRVPESLAEGLMEETLGDAWSLFSRISYPHGPVRRPYYGLGEEARLLSQLARALRLRMRHVGSMYISGLDYFNSRLDLFLERARAALGYNPKLPLTLYRR